VAYFLHHYAADAPIVEPVSLQEALLQCHALGGVEDDFFLTKIRAGREKVEAFTRRSLIATTCILTFDAAADVPDVIVLPRGPLVGGSISSITVDGEARWPLTGLPGAPPLVTPTLRPGEPRRVTLSGYTGGALSLTYRSGYSSSQLPRPLKDAILLYVSWSYENRAAETDVPKAFYDLIRPYQLWI